MSDFVSTENYRNSVDFQDNQAIQSKYVTQHVSNDSPPPIPRRMNNNLSYQQPSPYLGSSYGNMFSNPYQQSFYPGYGLSSGMYQQQSLSNGVEDATRSAFQSAESMIRVFSSVSMMLESTLFALQNSIRAIASVADQFSNLKLQLMSSCLSIIKMIRYYFRRMLVLFKVRKPESHDKIWNDLQNGVSNSTGKSKHWPVILFFAVTVGMPWMLWKMLSSVLEEKQQDGNWDQGIGEHYVAEVSYDFTSENADELSIKNHEIIRIAPKHKQPNVQGWLLASNGSKKGLVPANYVKIKGKNRPPKTEPKKIIEIEELPESSSQLEKESDINQPENDTQT